MKHYYEIDERISSPVVTWKPSKETLQSCGKTIWDLYHLHKDPIVTRHKFEDLCVSAAYDYELAESKVGTEGGLTKEEIQNSEDGPMKLLIEFLEAGYSALEFPLLVRHVASDCIFALYVWD